MYIEFGVPQMMTKEPESSNARKGSVIFTGIVVRVFAQVRPGTKSSLLPTALLLESTPPTTRP